MFRQVMAPSRGLFLVLQASVRDQKKLLVENGKLKKDIEQLKAQLQEKQRRRTGKPPKATFKA